MQKTEDIVASIGIEKTLLISTEQLSELLNLITSFINNSNVGAVVETEINKSIADSAVAIILLSHIFDREKILSHIEDKINEMNLFANISRDKLLKFMLLKDSVLIPHKQEMIKEVVIEAICQNNNILRDDLFNLNDNQKRDVVFIRQLIMYALRMLNGRKYRFTLAYVGGIFGKDHATASHAIKLINNLRDGGSASDKSKIRFVDNYTIKLLQ